MKRQLISRIVLLITMIVFCSSIFGVFATWIFADLPISSKDELFNVNMSIWEFTPEEVLPDDNEATDLHQNHYNLIMSIVNHVDYGLNATKKPIIRRLLENGAGVVYSNQSVSGGNLKHMLLDGNDVNALMFAVEYETDTKYNAYTFRESDLNIGAVIEVYKTVIEKVDGKWKATLSYEGTAKVFIAPNSVVNIDVTTWDYA